MKKIGLLSLLFLLFISGTGRPDVMIDKKIYKVFYSQTKEQPLWLEYKSSNRPTNVNRGSMDFYGEQNIITSDHNDYAKNVWDKGHIAPAATFSDNMENLKTTFSYLNCALQDQYLNRGEWRLLEEQERKWDDKEVLEIKVDLKFDKNSFVIPTGATVPSGFTKHIHFVKSNKWECYYFPNTKPDKKWLEYKISCVH